ncbi:MAG: methyltransferase domain-containing protein [Burkholderiaceae bacterium]
MPALFAQWGPVVCAAAGVGAGQRVLDVACGTGVLAGAARDCVGPRGAVAGLDPNVEMLAVARRRRHGVEWHEGRAEALPFPDASFDRVVSQFGLMFFDDAPAALREMRRVLRPGGRVAVAVWDALARSPGYAALAALVQRLFGDAVAASFRAPWALGDANRLLDLCEAAGIDGAQVSRHARDVRFASIDALVAAEHACLWTLGGLLDDAQFERLRGEARAALCGHCDADGVTRFALPALIVVAGKEAT